MKDPRDFNTPEGQILGPEHVDNLARAVLALTREVAVLTDRVMVIETLLEREGVVSVEAIDTFAPDAAFQQRTDAAMTKITAGVVAALQGTDRD
ncbi:hypothetical protein [Erythrobacter sp. HL-111]|uniref:hypothetical protein n=1 Tax=Erythrobacter sp. HL-111 TaxID=1798193 RepID=UPI0006DA1F0D|nr:hypothetical protein [Erythrobacter sp. HL-111]KPP96302.1 MAG: hypothetical protein HLUCCO15_01570 [Erythrobacteraceae bacterium HL-111]SDR74186.1 hypothetical protein SAMN04515621_0244 [Erythrobacter sp. HL-111]